MTIYIVLVIFFTFLLIGFLDYKKTNNIKGYVIANKSQSSISVGMSLSATIMGASSTIGMAALVYKIGLPGIWWLLSGVLGLIVLHLFLAKKANLLNVMTLPEAMGKFYGEYARIFAAVLIVIAWSGIVAAQFIAAGKVLSAVSSIDYKTLVISFGIFTIAYTVIGGQFSVFKTDKIQFSILFIGIAAVALFLVTKYKMPSINNNLLSFPINSHFEIKKLLLFLFVVGLPYAAGPDMYSRIFAAKNPEAAKNGILFTIIAVLIFASMIAIIGIYAHSFQTSGEKMLIDMVKTVLPPYLSYVFIAAILSAIVSSADTCLLSASTITSLDIFKHTSVKSIRITTLIIGTVSILIALYYGGIIKTLLISYGVYTGSVAVPLVFGFFKDKLYIDNRYAIFAIVASAIVALILSVSKNEYAGLISITVSSFILFIGHLLSKTSKQTVSG
jgi:SSS family solute:Na+ symporter